MAHDELLIEALADNLTPPDRDFWVYDSMLTPDDDGVLQPSYSVKEVSRFFFGKKSGEWLRWRQRPNPPKYPHGYFVLDGEPIVPKRTEADFRYFTLADVERMAHAAAQQGGIDSRRLITIIMLVKWTARLWGIIDADQYQAERARAS